MVYVAYNRQVWKKCAPFRKSKKNLLVSDHFLKFRCRKSARRCGANEAHLYKVKSDGFGALLNSEREKIDVATWSLASDTLAR